MKLVQVVCYIFLSFSVIGCGSSSSEDISKDENHQDTTVQSSQNDSTDNNHYQTTGDQQSNSTNQNNNEKPKPKKYLELKKLYIPKHGDKIVAQKNNTKLKISVQNSNHDITLMLTNGSAIVESSGSI